MVLLTSIESIIPIIFLIGLGFYLQKKNWFADSFGDNISRLIMNVALPSSILVSVLKYLTLSKLIKVAPGLLYTLSSVAIGYLIAFLAVKVFKVRAGRRGIFMNVVANANTIFIGLPLNIALFGNGSLAYFLVYYITNTLSTWAFGVFLISGDPKEGEKKQKASFNWKKLLPPPLLGFLVALLILVSGITLPSLVSNSLTYLGNLVTPLSLIYIGIVLAKAGLSSVKFDRDTILALIGRFLLMPLVTYALIALFGSQLAATEVKTFIVQAAVPALAVLPILANEAGGDVEFATNTVTTSTLLFIIVIPVVVTLLG